MPWSFSIRLTSGRKIRADHAMKRALAETWNRFGYSVLERKGADQTAGYLAAKQPTLTAPPRHKGWPIAIGILEGARRHLVTDRMEPHPTRLE